MARPFTFADREPPAEIREHAPLFDWAREQAAAAKQLDERIALARERHERTVTVLHESMEFREVEAARERVRDAKKAAVEDDPAVAKAADALKKARAALKKSAREVVNAEKSARLDVKILVQTKDETERGIVGALKAGRVPSDNDFVVPSK